MVAMPRCRLGAFTFNRTSMESKQIILIDGKKLVQPFNRTSMESKRTFASRTTLIVDF